MLFKWSSSWNCPKVTEICPFLNISHIHRAFLKPALLTALCCLLEKKLSSFLKRPWYLPIWIAWSVALWSREGVDLALLPVLHHIFACLSKTAIKTLKQNVKFVQTFFYQVFGCPKINFGPMTWRQSHPPSFNPNTFKYDPKVTRSTVTRVDPKAWPNSSLGFEPETFWFWV